MLDPANPPRNITRYQKTRGHTMNGYRVHLQHQGHIHIKYFPIPTGQEADISAWLTALNIAYRHLRTLKKQLNLI